MKVLYLEIQKPESFESILFYCYAVASPEL